MESGDSEKLTTEQRILIAAREEFAQKGFYGAKTISIAQAAGVTHAMLHYYYRTKQHYYRTKQRLYDRIAEDNLNRMVSVLSMSIMDGKGSIFDTTRSIIEMQMDFFSKNPQIPKFIINELSLNTSLINLLTDNAKNKFATLISLLQKQITEGVRQNQCRYVNADTILLDILSLDITPFILEPALLTIFIQEDMTFQEFIALRTQENIMTIHCKLKP